MTPAALHSSIVDRLLEFAALYPEVTTSDLQGMAAVIAGEIVTDCQGELAATMTVVRDAMAHMQEHDELPQDTCPADLYDATCRALHLDMTQEHQSCK